MASFEQKVLPNGWTLNVSDHVEVFSTGAIDQALALLKEWRGIYPKGDTLVGRDYGSPSLIVRLDCVVDPEEKLHLFEVEERPCGIGVAKVLVPQFESRLSEMLGMWPEFRWVSSPHRITDDALALGEGLSLEQAFRHAGALLVRSRPEDRDYHPLEHRAISSVRHEGDKHYGERMNLWRRIEWLTDPSEQAGGYVSPPLDRSCVLRPLRGTRCNMVAVYLHDAAKEAPLYGVKRNERLSPGEVESRLRRSGPAFAQPLIMPTRRDALGARNMIYRMFFGLNTRSGEFEPMGGMWMARESLLVHGQNDAVVGALVFDG
ncbi:hypothetical protein K2X96_01985 [Patescibacteria group bacterium]|nr:hypothetical protein [Patescibacteria group bacterium]